MPDQAVVFTLDGQRYGLPLAAVDRVVRMAAITPLPRAPDNVLGIINVQGRVIPVINLRGRFRLPVREPSPADQLVIARTTRRMVALVADEVLDLIGYAGAEAVSPHDILPGIECVRGVVKLASGLILVHDLDGFLSLEEDAALGRALENA
ncbi:MAG: purine-binding chemotaxis protein CheW [Nitrosomonadales bacterium]|nr:purine-binding chemotaxis protein CheW [Nitrosomonadales bacterium]